VRRRGLDHRSDGGVATTSRDTPFVTMEIDPTLDVGAGELSAIIFG
jgi:hypothetical protein